MSYENLSNDAYRFRDPWQAAWQLAPVPGWGINPLVAGPARIAMNGCGQGCACGGGKCGTGAVEADQKEYTGKQLALGVGAGLVLGGVFGVLLFGR